MENPAQELALSAQTIWTQTQTLSPEERIAAIDQWLKTHSSQRAGERQQRPGTSNVTPSPNSGMASRSPTSRQDQAATAWSEEIISLRTANLSPEERIKQVALAIPNLQRQPKLRNQEQSMARDIGTQRTRLLQDAPGSPEERFAAKIQKLRMKTKNVNAEERIATIDAQKEELAILANQARAAKSTKKNSNHPLLSK